MRLRRIPSRIGDAVCCAPLVESPTQGRPNASALGLSIVIPVYNEGENVIPTLTGLYARVSTRPFEVLVVHDFDEDTTVPVVRRLQPEMGGLALHRNRLGRGALNAVKSGLGAAAAPYVLVM